MITNNKINFILPGFLNISRNEILINIYEKHPYITTDNSCIHSFYGNFPSCLWNGGRLCLGERYSIKQMKKIKKFHNKHRIAIALTMTNLLLEEKHLDDKYSNDIAKVFHDGYNEILVSTNILEKYIRNFYPKYKINKSITSKDDPLKTLDRYNLSLIPSQYSNDESYINKISTNYRKTIEILCNDPCLNNCEYKYLHYKELCSIQLNTAPSVENRYKYYGNCRHLFFLDFNAIKLQRSQQLYLPPEKLQYIVDMYGIKYFKINAREKYNYMGYDNIVEYCIKDKYKNDILNYFLERLTLEYEEEVIYQTKKYGNFATEQENDWLTRDLNLF